MKCKIFVNVKQHNHSLELINELDEKGLLVNGEINCDEARDKEVIDILDKHLLNKEE